MPDTPDDNATPMAPLPSPLSPFEEPGRRDVDWTRDQATAEATYTATTP